jgi:endonuclease/exonuclease/phosphatase family metal-dependent hydrolase
VQALERFAMSLQATNGIQAPYLLCGDFNVEPHYPFYKLLSTGTLDTKELGCLATYDYVNQYPGTTLPKKVSPY